MDSCCLVAKWCLTLCDTAPAHPPPTPPPSPTPAPGVSQARILEWVAISFSRGSSQTWDGTWVSCIDRQILYHWATRVAQISSYLGLRGRGRGLTENWQENPWVDRNILYLDYGGSSYKWHIVIKISQIIYFKGVHFTVCKLYFNKVDLKNKTYWHKIITIFVYNLKHTYFNIAFPFHS